MIEFASFEDSRRTRANVLFLLGKRHSFASLSKVRDTPAKCDKFLSSATPCRHPLTTPELQPAEVRQ